MPQKYASSKAPDLPGQRRISDRDRNPGQGQAGEDDLYREIVEGCPYPTAVATVPACPSSKPLLAIRNASMRLLQDSIGPDEFLSIFRSLLAAREIQEGISRGIKRFTREYRATTKTGVALSLSWTVAHLRPADGNASRWLVTVEDKTERQTLERQLREARQASPSETHEDLIDELGDVIGGAHCIIWHADIRRKAGGFEWQVRFVDEDSVRKWHPLNDHPGVSYLDAMVESVVPEDQARRAEVTERALETGAPGFTLEFRTRTATGEVLWLSETARIKKTGPDAWNLVAICIDVTEQKKAQEALQAERNLLRTIIDAIPDELFMGDFNQKFLMLNRAAAEFMDIDQARIAEGLYLSDVFPPVVVEKFVQDGLPLVDGTQDRVHNEFMRMDKNGELRWISVTMVSVKNAQGERHGLVGFVRDISDYKFAVQSLAEERNLLRTIIDAVPDEIFVKDSNQKILLYNKAACEYTRVDPDRIERGLTLWDVFPHKVVHHFIEDEQCILSGECDELAAEFMRVDNEGELGWVGVTRVPLKDEYGKVRGLVGFVRDISDYKFAAQKLAEDQVLMRTLIDNLPSCVFFKDLNGNFRINNKAHAKFLGVSSPEELTGRNIAEFASPQFYAEVQAQDKQILQTGLPITNQIRRSAPGVPPSWTSITKLPVLGASGEMIGFLGILQDITHEKEIENERKRMLAEALERANCDPLTGLLNHRAFHERLKHFTTECVSARRTCALVMLDLDNFKFFNDAYGHQAGDDVLCTVADALRAIGGGETALARLGGDEFAMILPDTDAEAAERFLDRLLAAMGEAKYRPGSYDWEIPLDFSAGFAVFPDDARTRIELQEIADRRLKDAKYGSGASANLVEEIKARLTGTFENFMMLNALVTAVDNKDRYTRRHSDDVLTYSIQIAEGLGLGEETMFTVRIAALLHDVGKIGVPDSILRKPGKLTEEEFAAIKQHPSMGAVIVSSVPGFEATLDAVRYHHERWDGKGYPSGLAGEDIPLIGRLMAVADAYSAMTTDRPYRKAMAAAQAEEILRGGAGTQWDPVCVEAFFRTRAAKNRP